MPEEHLFQDGTLSFLPTRLNRQPVVIGGLTADEMWITVFTWFYRQVEMALSLRFPVFGNRRLVTRSGAWTSRRTESP